MRLMIVQLFGEIPGAVTSSVTPPKNKMADAELNVDNLIARLLEGKVSEYLD